MRASECVLNRPAGPERGRLMPCLAVRPIGSDPVDAEALSRELVHLVAVGRRACSS